jgi:pimeloyl-ACP methyl ester carboxylesterase
VRARGIELGVEITGPDAGVPLFWGHGLMGSVAQENEAGVFPWRGLAASGVRVIRWDARGHGVSEATLAEKDYRWEELALDLWSLVDVLGVERATLGGVSMGAATALHAAVRAPERARGLVLMAPPTAWESRPRQASIYRGGARMIDYVGLSPFRWLGQLSSLSVSNRGLAALQCSIMRGLRGADPRAIQAALRGAALSDLPPRERVAALEIPSLILAWTGDPSHPLSSAEALAGLLPGSDLHVARDHDEILGWSSLVRDFVTSL